MADQFNIDAKLVIAGVEVKGDLNAGKLKFDIDTSALKKLVADAASSATKVKTKIDSIKFNKIKLELNQGSLRTMKNQIRAAIQEAAAGVKIKGIGVAQGGAAGQLSRVGRAAQATQPARNNTNPQSRLASGRFGKAALGFQRSAESLARALEKAGATIRPNAASKPLSQAQINKGNRGRAKFENRAAEIKRAATAERELNKQKLSDEQAATKTRLTQIKQEANAERLANRETHRKKMAQIDAELRKSLASLQKRIAADPKKGRAPKLDPAFRGRNATQLREEFQLGRGSTLGGGGDVSQGGGRGRGRLSDFGSGGGGRGGGRAGPGASPGGPGRGGGDIDAASKALANMTSQTKGATKAMDSLEELSFQVGKKAAAFRGVAIAINTIVTASQAAVQFVIQLNDSLIEVNKILQLSDASLKKLGDDLFALSAKTGVAVNETVAISEAFARAGLSGRGYGSVVDLTARALTGMQGTTLEAGQATELFIQIIQQVEGGARGLNKTLVTTTKLFDVLGKAEDITASKATDVQAAFKRSAASVLATGASIEQATTLISVLQERTQRGGDVIGTALKTMAARISSSTSDATKALNSIGVSTIDAEGNLRNLFDVLEDTAVAFGHLSEAEQADIAVKAAGIRQVEIFRSAVRDFGRMQSVNTQLTEASGDASRKQRAEWGKLSNVLSRLQIGFQQMVKTASDSTLGQIFVGAIRMVEGLVTGISKFDKAIGGALSTALGFGAVVVAFKVILPMLVGIGRAIRFFMGAQKEAATNMAAIQKGASAVGTTIETKMVASINHSVEATTRLRIESEGVARALFLASQAQRQLAAAQGRSVNPLGPGSTGGMPNRGNTSGAAGGGPVIIGGASLPGAENRRKQGLGERTRRGISNAREQTTKQMGKFKKGIMSLGKNFTALGILAAVAGGALQTWAQSLRDSGSGGAATAVEGIGGALQGAGTGAIIGSLIAPGIGTAIGAVLGGIGGALPTLGRMFDTTAQKTREMAKELQRLGVIQAKNGEITSEAAAKIEAALLNIENIKGLGIAFEGRAQRKKRDPRFAEREDTAEGIILETLVKTIKSSVGASKRDEDNQATIFQALSKFIEQQSGKQINFLGKSTDQEGTAFEDLGSKGLEATQASMIKFVEALGAGEDALLAFKVKLGIIKEQGEALARSPGEVKRDKERAAKGIQSLKTHLDKALPDAIATQEMVNRPFGAGGPGLRTVTETNDKAIGELREAIKELAAGETTRADPRFDAGIAAVGEKGILTTVGGGREKMLDEVARLYAQALVDQADVLNQMRKGIKGANLQRAAGQSKEAFEALVRQINAAQQTTAAIASTAKRAAGTKEAFAGIDKIGDSEVNELKLAFRIFIQDFSKEVLKLNEARIRATTPQVELANALAMNAHEVLQAADKNRKIQLDTSRLTAEKALGEISSEGKLLQSSPNKVRGAFPELREGGLENATAIEDRLKKLAPKQDVQVTLDALFRGGDIEKLGKVFFGDKFKRDDERKSLDPDESDEQDRLREKTKQILKFGTTTVKTALDNFHAAVQNLIDDSFQRGIDPGEGLKNLATTTKGFEALSKKQKETVIKIETDHAKRSVAIEKEALDARLKFNQLSIAAIKFRISHERQELAVNKSLREASALNARAMAEELTGIRRLVAERQIATKLAKADIAETKDRLSRVGGAVTALKSGPKDESKEEKTTRVNQLKVLEDEFAKTRVELTKKTGALQVATMRDVMKAARAASDEGKRVATNERGRIGALSEIGKLLSVDQSKMQGFNAELATLGANFKISQAGVAAQAEAAKKIEDPEERGKQLDVARQAGVTVALEMAKAEAQLESKRRSAIKQLAGKLLANQQAQITAQKAVIDTTKALSDAYEAYLQAVDGVVMATTQYNLAISLADVAARKTTGGFTGLREEIGAVQAAFSEAERMAAEMGASEKTLVEIRRQSIDQQLSLFNELLSQQSAAARSFFTSSAEDQADLARGIGEAKGIAELLGGSFDAFKSKSQDEGALNQLGAQIMSLPQDMRKRIQEAIDTLKVTGGTIGGFTAEELEAAINSAAFGESAELQVDPLFEVQERIAGLQQEQAKIATEQLIAANEQMQDAKKGVELAEEQKALAEIQLERVKEDGEKLRSKMGELKQALNTTLLTQIQVTKQGHKGIMAAVERAASRMITELPSFFNVAMGEAIDQSNEKAADAGIIPGSKKTPPSDLQQEIDNRKNGQNKGVDAAASAAAGVGNGQASPPKTTSSNNPNDPNSKVFASMLGELQAIKKNSAANLVVTQSVKDTQDNAAAPAAIAAIPKIEVSIEGTSTVTVTGFEAGVTRIAQGLIESFGGFATEEEARAIANEVVENIRKALLENGTITRNTQ